MMIFSEITLQNLKNCLFSLNKYYMHILNIEINY